MLVTPPGPGLGFWGDVEPSQTGHKPGSLSEPRESCFPGDGLSTPAEKPLRACAGIVERGLNALPLWTALLDLKSLSALASALAF